MIHDLIIFTLVTIGWCLGFQKITEHGMILNFLRRPFEKKNLNGDWIVPEWIASPIILCISCTASFHGVLIFLILWMNKVIEFNFFTLILGCVMASFIQTFIYILSEELKAKMFYFQNKNNERK